MTDYRTICNQLRAVTQGVKCDISNLANAAALLQCGLTDVNWVGFYLYDGNALCLGPFQGKPACVRLQLDRGVCAAAVRGGKTLIVDDVHSFDGHIACDSASDSEIVVPIYAASGNLYGVLDIDSPVYARFTDDDARGLEQFVQVLQQALFGAA